MLFIFLVFNISFNGAFRYMSNSFYIVGSGPQRRKFSFEVSKFVSQCMRCISFKLCDDASHRINRICFNEYVDVIRHHFHRFYNPSIFCCLFMEQDFESTCYVIDQYGTSILRAPYYVVCDIVDCSFVCLPSCSHALTFYLQR